MFHPGETNIFKTKLKTGGEKKKKEKNKEENTWQNFPQMSVQCCFSSPKTSLKKYTIH